MAPTMQEPAVEPAAVVTPGVDDLGPQLAGVTRALEWALAGEGRLASAPWLGTSCARRLDTVAQRELGDTVEGLAARLRALDGVGGDERMALAESLHADLVELSPLSLVGARVMGLPEQGKLLQPRRRRRGKDAKESLTVSRRRPERASVICPCWARRTERCHSQRRLMLAPTGIGGTSTLVSCCAEMDIWEANQWASAYTAHPCAADGQV